MTLHLEDDIEDDADDPHAPCGFCAEEHPMGVLEDGLCPRCVDLTPCDLGANCEAGEG